MCVACDRGNANGHSSIPTRLAARRFIVKVNLNWKHSCVISTYSCTVCLACIGQTFPTIVCESVLSTAFVPFLNVPEHDCIDCHYRIPRIPIISQNTKQMPNTFHSANALYFCRRLRSLDTEFMIRSDTAVAAAVVQ